MARKKEGMISKSIRHHAHPVPFVLHIIGITLGFWGLWVKNWIAVFVGFFFWPIIGHIYEWFGQERVELWVTEHFVNVTNMILHIAAFALLVYAIYTHQVSLGFLAFGISILGHLYVWWFK